MKQPITVVVTGASAGLGRAIAREFGSKGARVALISRDADALRAAAQEVEEHGGKALPIAVDVSDAAALDAAASKVEEELGPIDVWVNDAMVSVFAPVKDVEPEEYRRVTEVNYLGYVYGTLSALHRMLPRNHGRIIQVGSALAVRSIPLQSAYCGTKHAIIGFTDSLRCELYHDKSDVKVSVVQMPAMNTPQFTWLKNRMQKKPQPVPPIFQPEVSARVVVHAALTPCPRREYWVGSSTVKAIVGQKIIPGLLDRYLGKTGYKSQLLDEDDNPDRPNNLWEPVASPLGERGPFDKKSKDSSTQVDLDLNRGWIMLAFGLVGAAFALKKIVF